MRERIDEGSGERRSSRVGGQFSIRVRIRDTQSRQTHMYFDYYGSKPQTHMHTASVQNNSGLRLQDESPDRLPRISDPSLRHPAPRGLSVSHMT